MHVTTTRRHYKDKVYETHLLRRSVRVDGKVHNETLANLSHLSADVIEMIRGSLKGERFVPADAAVTVTRSRPHGHVAAAWAMAQGLGLPALLGPACPDRDLALALVISRVVRPAGSVSSPYSICGRPFLPSREYPRLASSQHDPVIHELDRSNSAIRVGFTPVSGSGAR
jgi:hypothetical protein